MTRKEAMINRIENSGLFELTGYAKSGNPLYKIKNKPDSITYNIVNADILRNQYEQSLDLTTPTPEKTLNVVNKVFGNRQTDLGVTSNKEGELFFDNFMKIVSDFPPEAYKKITSTLNDLLTRYKKWQIGEALQASMDKLQPILDKMNYGYDNVINYFSEQIFSVLSQDFDNDTEDYVSGEL